MNRRAFLETGIAAGLAASVPMRSSPAAEAPLRLNSNENPRGLSTKCRRAVERAIPEAGRYPFSHLEPLRQALAARHGLAPENVVLGNGSSEVIQMAVQALAPPGARLVMALPTFDNVEQHAREGVNVVKIPLDADFAHDLEAMRQAAESARHALVYVCNPNNPTATLTSCTALREWIRRAPPEVAFLVDEAYFDYVEDPGYCTMIPQVTERANLVVTRTFSKVYGMAGLRLGYGLCGASTAERLLRWSSDANINHLAAMAGLQALEDDAYRRSSLDLNREAREILLAALDRLKLARLPSHTNFVMHRIPGDLATYIERMRRRGVLVGRRFPPLLQYNRVTLGSPREMTRFVAVLDEFREQGWV